MTIDSVPDLARHAVSPKDATKLPGAPKDERTVIRWLTETDKISGYIQPGGERNRYKVYADQFGQPDERAPKRSRGGTQQADLQAKLERLEADNDLLRTHLATATAGNDRLQADNQRLRIVNEQLAAALATSESQLAAEREAKRVVLATNALTIEATEMIRKSASSALESADSARMGAEQLYQVVGMQRDLLAQYMAPEDLGDIPTI
jgi:hypothetical protein